MQTTNLRIMLAACAVTAMGASAASADCAQELAALSTGSEAGAAQGGEISKDGSLAPLEDGTSGSAGAAEAAPDTGGEQAGDGEVAKDGSTAPLEEESGQGADVATSGQEAQGQQEQAQQDMAAGGSEQSDALERARAALAEGDEAGCMEALDQASQM